jgi:hypothetical protein
MSYKRRLRDAATPTGQVERAACETAWEVQDACNLRALTAAWLEHIDLMIGAGLDGDEINSHPSTLAFLSKLNSLTHMNPRRESAALNLCREVAHSREPDMEYEVIPLRAS